MQSEMSVQEFTEEQYRMLQLELDNRDDEYSTLIQQECQQEEEELKREAMVEQRGKQNLRKYL